MTLKKNKKNILVVGGAGYVGGAVVDLLQQKNYNIRVYDNLTYEENYYKEVSFYFGDVKDYKKIKKHLTWADVVVWMAAMVGDGACNIDNEYTNDVNFKSVQNLVKNFKKRIIFFSTCSVYGAQNKILHENSKTNPLSLYASTKLQAEKILKKRDALIFRLGTLYGLGDKFSRIRMDLVLNTLTNKAINERKLVVYGGNQYRPLLHVKDAARAILLGIENSKVKGIFNLHYKNIKILNLALIIKKIFKNVKIEKVKVKYQDARNYRVNGSKVAKELGFKAKYNLEYGINEIAVLLKQKRIKNINNVRYINEKFLNEKKTK